MILKVCQGTRHSTDTLGSASTVAALTTFDEGLAEMAEVCAMRYRGIVSFGIGVLLGVAIVMLVFFATL